MSKPQPQKTAAEQYAELKEKQFENFLEQSFSDEALKDVELFEVTSPSGMKFKCRKVGKEYATQFGQLPVAMTAQMIEAKHSNVAGLSDEAKEKIAEERFEKSTPIEQRAMIQASAQMVRYVAVSPRLIVGEVNGHKDAISVDALTIDDFKCLSQWATGGGAAPGLKTFRRKRR